MKTPASGRPGRGTMLACGLGVLLALTCVRPARAVDAASPQPGNAPEVTEPKHLTRPPAAMRRYMMPSVTLAQYTKAGSDSIKVWAAAMKPFAADRSRLYRGIEDLLRQHVRFSDRVGRTYPKNQIEWLLVTDGVADTLATAVQPLLDAYCKAHPEEILTGGRQKIELALMNINGPPSNMLGFHVAMMGDFIYAKADTLLRISKEPDRAGVEEGVLRAMADWTQLYKQAHADPISVFECRMKQEDWIVARLEDACGNHGGGVWQLKEQWMAVVDRDTTVTPVVEKYAHEYHLQPVKCPEDTVRVFYIDLPNFTEVQMEVYRRQQEGKLSTPAQTGKK